MHPEIKSLIDSLKSGLICAISKDLCKLKEKLMSSQADLDAVIAGLPGVIEAALAPVIAAIEAKSAGQPVDFSPEIASLNGIAAAVAASITPPAAAPAAPVAEAPPASAQ